MKTNENKNDWYDGIDNLNAWMNWKDEEAIAEHVRVANDKSICTVEDYNLAKLGPRLVERAQNPIFADTLGKDQDAPKPAWVDENLLKQVEELKNKLFQLENKMNAKEGGGDKFVEKPVETDNKMWDQIQSLKKEIDSVSDKLGLKDEAK